MTQQFKFGDRAIHRTSGSICLIVDDTPVTTDDGKILWRVVDEDGFGGMCSDYKLTPVPHPDTVRLDWLADRDQHIGNVQLPTECVEQHLDSMRDAIDAAMQMQATEDA
nr:hypothetical protein [Neisseria meningitidis]